MTLIELPLADEVSPLADDEVWARPLADWLNERVARIGIAGVMAEFNLKSESDTRRIYRFRNCLVAGSRDGVKGDRPTDRYSRRLVESFFADAEVGVWEVYPALAEAGTAVERFCGTCHEVVTTDEDGVCPWCDHATEARIPPERKWCPGCDRMMWPTKANTCWRCGTWVRAMPWEPCECGCGESVHRFDRHGRRIKWVRGHAPRTREKSNPMPTEPFAEWLREEVKRVDPIASIVTRTNLTREEVIGLIEGRVDELDRERIRRALWQMGRAGSGTGAKQDVNVPGFFDLYPDDKRVKTCPGCGGGKAPHAEMCKKCRTSADRANGVTPASRGAGPRSAISEALVTEAYTLYSTTGHSILSVAEQIYERTPYTHLGSLTQALSREWKRRGWQIPAGPGARAAA